MSRTKRRAPHWVGPRKDESAYYGSSRHGGRLTLGQIYEKGLVGGVSSIKANPKDWSDVGPDPRKRRFAKKLQARMRRIFSFLTIRKEKAETFTE